VKKLLILVERYGLFVLVAFTAMAFVLAVSETMRRGDAAGSLLEAVLETVNSDAKDAEGWAKRMHMLLTLALGWAAVRLYTAAVGLKWDTFAARYLARGHVLIVAGRSRETQPQDDLERSASAGGALPEKSALAIDLALNLSRENSVVLSLPELDEGSRAKLWEAGVTVLSCAFQRS